MAQLQNQSIPRDKFLLMSVNLLHKAFIEASRTEAKKLYRLLAEGTPVGLSKVQMEDKSTLAVGLSLDQSEFRGRLNFGAFRSSVATLIGNVGKALQDGSTYPVFGGEAEAGGMIFGITAVTAEDGQANVMVLGTKTGDRGAGVMLRLMYLDPGQFVAATG